MTRRLPLPIVDVMHYLALGRWVNVCHVNAVALGRLPEYEVQTMAFMSPKWIDIDWSTHVYQPRTKYRARIKEIK